jgi:hypothetical protein
VLTREGGAFRSLLGPGLAIRRFRSREFTCNPSTAATLPNIGVSHYIGISHRVTYPYVVEVLWELVQPGNSECPMSDRSRSRGKRKRRFLSSAMARARRICPFLKAIVVFLRGNTAIPPS